MEKEIELIVLNYVVEFKKENERFPLLKELKQNLSSQINFNKLRNFRYINFLNEKFPGEKTETRGGKRENAGAKKKDENWATPIPITLFHSDYNYLRTLSKKSNSSVSYTLRKIITNFDENVQNKNNVGVIPEGIQKIKRKVKTSFSLYDDEINIVQKLPDGKNLNEKISIIIDTYRNLQKKQTQNLSSSTRKELDDVSKSNDKNSELLEKMSSFLDNTKN